MGGIFHLSVSGNASVFKDYHPLVIHAHKAVLMRDHDNRGPLPVEPHKQVDNLHAHSRVNIAGGLVRYNKIRIVREGAGKRHTLLFAAGELIGITARLVGKSDYADNIGHTFAYLLLFCADNAHCKRHVVIDGHLGDEPEILENNTHTST